LKSNDIILDDGKWHHVDITWSMTLAYMVIDHVHKIKMKITGGMVAGESLTQVTLGDTAKSGKGFKGCIKGIALLEQLHPVSWTLNKLL
jgi:hypothetical protein